MNAPAQRRPWRFWLITLAALAAVLLTASLGRWQLARAAQKRALQSAIDERQHQPPLAPQALARARASLPPELLHRRVQLRGRWVAQATVFLDNRQMYGRPGFFVLTPMRLAHDPASVVLVQRGWVARDFLQRTRLPEVPTPDGEVSVQGRVAAPPFGPDHVVGEVRGNHGRGADQQQGQHLPAPAARALQRGQRVAGRRQVVHGQAQRLIAGRGVAAARARLRTCGERHVGRVGTRHTGLPPGRTARTIGMRSRSAWPRRDR